MTVLRLPYICAVLGVALTLSACVATPIRDLPERSAGGLPTDLPPMNRFGAATPDRPARSNAEMAQDFLDLSFAMESGRIIERMSRFEGPISVTVGPGAPASLIPDLDRLIARLRREAHIDIRRVTAVPGAANITIETLPRAQMQRRVPEAACFVVPRVGSWDEFRRTRNGRDLDWTTLTVRDRVAVFLPNDVSPQEVRDCLHEEVAQALGPLNDLYRLPDSVFNDDNLHAVLTGFDMLMLRAYYDPALRSGMTRGQAAAVIGDVLDRLNPAGAAVAAARVVQTPRAWVGAIETALGPGTSAPGRLEAADRAVAIARQAGLTDGRLAFSYFALARLSLSRDADRSIGAFQAAANIYDRIAPGGIQVAHIDMQLAAFALSAGRAEEALRLAGRAERAAVRAQNASLLATLLMIRAAALDDLGRPAEARAVRLDSLAWGRYGFDGNAAVGARLTEVSALSP